MQKKAKKDPLVCVVVVTWNSADCISRCLQSLQASALRPKVVVVDNNSADNTRTVVGSFAGITCINTGDNLGYAAAINIGLEWAAKQNADFTLLLNPDAYLAADCIGRLAVVMQREPSVALASPKIYYADSEKIWFAGATLDLKNGTSHHIGQDQPDNPTFGKNHDLPRANGCAMMVRMTALPDFGFMDERYFLYFEETDWSLQCRAAGHRILFVANAHCWHDASSSTGGFFSPLYQYYNTRNSLYLFHKFGSGSWILFVLRHLHQSLKRVLIVLNAKPAKTPRIVIAMLRGYWDYSLGRMGRRTN